jgi:hypothetical protein
MRLIILAEGEEAPVWRHLEGVDELARRMDALGLAVQVRRDELALALVAHRHEQPVAGRAELRHGRVLRHADRHAAARRDPVDARIVRPPVGGEIPALPAFEHDGPAVGRKGGSRIMAGLRRHIPRRAAARRYGADAAQPRIRPVDERDRPTVARPSGIGFDAVAFPARQPARRAARHRLDPELAERLEHHLTPIRRHHRPARDLGREAIGGDLHLRVLGVSDHARVVDPERDLGRARPVGVHPPDLSAGPEDDVPAVRRPGHVRIDPGDGPGLLHVLIERIVDLALLPRHQVLHIELRFRALATDKGDLLAVGRRRRPHCAAGALGGRHRLARLQIIAFDMKKIGVGVLSIFEDRAGCDVAGEIDMLAVRRVDRLAQFLLVLLVRALDQRHAAPARNVIEPDLARAERASGCEMLLGDDEAAVRAPARLVEEAEILFGHLALVGPVGVHDPDVVAARPV